MVKTITRRIAAMRYAHALRGIDPLPQLRSGQGTMKGSRRTKGAARARKAPATSGIIADMIARCPQHWGHPRPPTPLPVRSGAPNWPRSPWRS
jgi:hypothetical protein